ncbi:MAG: YbaL family putative K(+) efflux transporter [Phenylobacterium sp.]
MPHHTTLIATLVAGLTCAFIFGALAQRLKVSPLVGYLVAGVVVGPFTPGYVADGALATQLAEIGVILLMFGVGLHFSLKDLLAVRKIAIPGALGQMAAATLLGMGLGHLLGWPPTAGFVFGLALSVASTVVLLRALQERRMLQTDRGRIAVGWLIVEDLAMVLALVLLPALAGAIQPDAAAGGDIWRAWVMPLGITLAKVAGFIAFMLVVGRRVIPWILHYVAHTGSRELFRLAVLAIALGVAFGAASLFGVSFALGAFFAGMILAESELSQRAAEETLPLRDAFAVLFFVSVGMLFNPQVVLRDPWALLATLGIITLGKSLAALLIVRAFGYGLGTSLTISASLAQIGEFSFILAGLGVGLGLLPEQGRDLILAGAILSIVLNPLVFTLAGRLHQRRRPEALTPMAPIKPSPEEVDLVPTALEDHTVLVGFGRVGAMVAEGLDLAAAPFLVIEDSVETAARARALGFEALQGNAADGAVLGAAGLTAARRLIVAIPDSFEAGQVVEQARRANPRLEILARAHSDEEVAHLSGLGADEVVLGEHQIARALLAHALGRTGTVAPAPAGEPATPGSRPRLILDDAEWALLSGVEAQGAEPGASVSRAAVTGHAAGLGAFDEARLATAIIGLAEKGLIEILDMAWLRVTASGAEAARVAPKY